MKDDFYDEPVLHVLNTPFSVMEIIRHRLELKQTSTNTTFSFLMMLRQQLLKGSDQKSGFQVAMKRIGYRHGGSGALLSPI
jgi:hypothetical protein